MVDHTESRADSQYLKDGAVTLFWRKTLFDGAKADLMSVGYHVAEIRCLTVEELIADVSEALKWRAQFGYEPWTGNLDAFSEGLSGAPFSSAMCFAFCFEDYERIAGEDSVFAHDLLDLIEYESRNHLVFGRRLIACVQTSDGSYRADDLGKRSAGWTGLEFFDANRR